MQRREILKVTLRKEPFIVNLRGSIDVGLLCVNCHKISFIASEDLL